MLLAGEIKVREPDDPARIEPDTGVKVVAVNQAQSEGATGLRWSDDAAAISFSFGAPTDRTVYIENVFSVGFKLEQVQSYALGGVAVADASAHRDVANIWPAVNQLLEAGTVNLVRPNGDALVPRWEAPDGGTLDAAAGPSVVWRADEAGTYTLRMLFSDGDLVFGREIKVEVKAKPAAAPTPLVTFPAEEPTPTPTPTPTATAAPTPTPTPEGDVTAPSKITGVNITPQPGQFLLEWNPSAASDLSVYRIYATITADADFPDEYELVAEVPKGTNTYTDDDFTIPDDVGETFYYIVTAVDSSTNESVPSTVKSAVLLSP
jgi:hypothetical protein